VIESSDILYIPPTSGVVEEDDLRSLIFCDFVDPKNDSRPYVEVQNVDKLRLVMENYLDEYNNISKKTMNLVLFRYSVHAHCRAVTLCITLCLCVSQVCH